MKTIRAEIYSLAELVVISFSVALKHRPFSAGEGKEGWGLLKICSTVLLQPEKDKRMRPCSTAPSLLSLSKQEEGDDG